MARSVRIDSDDIVGISVRINGREVPDDVLIERVDVSTSLNRIPRATVVLVDGSATEETFSLSSEDAFLPGTKVEISAGYNTKLTTIYSGVLTRHAISISSQQETRLVLSCAARAEVLTKERKSRHFVEARDSDNMARILQDAGLGADVADTGETYQQSVQYNATDWDYLRMRAAANGQVVLVTDDTVKVASPELAAPEVSVGFGEAILAFDAELDGTSQVSEVEVFGWDSSHQEIVTATSREDSPSLHGAPAGPQLARDLKNPPETLRGHGDLSLQTLETWANGQRLMHRLARVRGRVRLVGSAGVVAGGTVELKGLGTRFNGTAYVSAVQHRIEAGTWTTEARFGLDPELVTPPATATSGPLAAALRPGAYGVDIAVVRQIHEDPGAQGRIQVAFPLSGDATLWVRLLTPYAGADTGMDFRPEVGDEVLVAFLGGDPESGVCLGALHSATRLPVDAADEDNRYKTIRTRGGSTIRFDDTSNAIELKTPGLRRVLLDDEARTIVMEDEDGNRVELSEAGLSLTSPADIQLKAEGSVKIAAKTEIALFTNGDATLDATGITQKSAGTYTIDGASGTVKASTSLKVQGAIVEIN